MGEVVFITRRAWPTWTKIQQIHVNASSSVFVMTAKTINRRVKAAAQAAGLGEGFSGHSDLVGLTRTGVPDSPIMRQG